MKDIFDILGVPADTSKSMLKESFMQWKKAQQDILRKGTPEEQKIAAEQISEVTALYKDAVKNLDGNGVAKEANELSGNSAASTPVKAAARISAKKSAPNWTKHNYASYEKRNDNKPLMVASMVILVICLCGGGYLFYNDDNFIMRNISLPGISSKKALPEYPKLPELPEISEKSREPDVQSSKQGVEKSSANESSNKVNSKKLTDEDIAREVFVKYHEALGNHNFHAAYGMMSPVCKQNMGDPDKLAVSFRDTIESKASNVTLVRTEKDEIVFDYILDSKDKTGGNKILYQTFHGQVHMFKIDGEWKVGYSESERINNYIK